MKKIDLNCDMGESYGIYQLGKDLDIMPYISSCNIACGFHGGDPVHITETLKNAINHKLAIGVHPSYPDLQGFGRRSMKIPVEELSTIILYQISAVKGLLELLGGSIRHIKPHGALYNDIAASQGLSKMMADITSKFKDVTLVGLANSVTKDICQLRGVPFSGEFFADRNYHPDGSLVSRTQHNAVLSDPEKIAKRVLNFVETGHVLSIKETNIPLDANTVCLHGDHPNAVENARQINAILKKSDIKITSNLHT